MTRTFRWRGRTVRWDRYGSGPEVVLLHGTPWSSRLWHQVAEHLSTHHTVYLWDMPGYGSSSKHAAHAVDLGVQGELFADLLGHWNINEPHVVAHDFGGAVALRARLLHDVVYASLCLVDVVALSPWGSPFFTLVKKHHDVFEQLPPEIHRGAIEAHIAGASHRGVSPEHLRMLTEPWLDAEGQSAFYRRIAQADESFTTSIESQYGTISEPVHIIWGTDDAWIPADRAHRLVRAIPHASLTLVPDAGHLIQLNAPTARR